MLQTINQQEHSDYPVKFRDAVRTILPILCFTPDQADAFINDFEPQFDGNSHVIEDEQGRLTFCRFTLDATPGEVFVDYLLPSVWKHRYTLVKGALKQLEATFLKPGSGRFLRLHIDERTPSHAAYYLGLLPELGFRLAPRVTMTAPRELARRLKPPLVAGFTELSRAEIPLAEAIDVYVRAFRGKAVQALSAEEWDRLRQSETPYLTEAYAREGAAPTWVGAAAGDQLVGLAFGDASGDRLSLEEVAVTPEYQGKGLGKYLTVRCLQKLYKTHGGAGKHFFLGTDRRWTKALNLYHGLGFTIDRVETYAFLPSPSDTV